jgi:hypothetical protein
MLLYLTIRRVCKVGGFISNQNYRFKEKCWAYAVTIQSDFKSIIFLYLNFRNKLYPFITLEYSIAN